MPSKHKLNALENEHRLVISLESYKNNMSQAGEICAFLVLEPRWGERAGVSCCDEPRSKASRGRADIVCTVLGYSIDGAFDARCRGGSLFTFLCCTHSPHLVLRASRHRCYPLQ